MDPFSVLPSSITITIAKLSPDLISLYNFLTASPVVASAFIDYGYEIFKAVLLHDDSLSDNLRELLVRRVLFRETAPVARLNILATHLNILRLACGILKAFITRSLKLKPFRLADPNFIVNHEMRAEWPQGIPCEVQDWGPPSWFEEQRVIAALWMVEVWMDSDWRTRTTSGEEGEDDNEKIERSWREIYRFWPPLEMKAVCDCLADVMAKKLFQLSRNADNEHLDGAPISLRPHATISWSPSVTFPVALSLGLVDTCTAVAPVLSASNASDRLIYDTSHGNRVMSRVIRPQGSLVPDE